MILKHISILNYKNLEQVELAFSPKLNTFFGQNGMGKTNLLDAVYFLSFCKSAGNPIDSQNIRHDADFFVIQGFYEASDGTPEEIYCGMKRRQKKQFKRNKKEYTRLSDHIGFLPLVMVSPADSALINGGSDEPPFIQWRFQTFLPQKITYQFTNLFSVIPFHPSLSSSFSAWLSAISETAPCSTQNIL